MLNRYVTPVIERHRAEGRAERHASLAGMPLLQPTQAPSCTVSLLLTHWAVQIRWILNRWDCADMQGSTGDRAMTVAAGMPKLWPGKCTGMVSQWVCFRR